jgi:hypothetical protein
MKMDKSSGIFSLAVFVGAFLLFQIQPMIGKYFLPWFGGASAVWMTCLMFFQILLLGGYAYAHFLQNVEIKKQVVWHVALMTAAILAGTVTLFKWGSPILPDLSRRPDVGGRPAVELLQLLLISIGLSYFILSSSTSLLQAWFHRIHPNRSPYVFYVVSNSAALLALISYPFLVEPNLTLHEQAMIWAVGFVLYVVLCLRCVSKVCHSTSFHCRRNSASRSRLRLGWKTPRGSESTHAHTPILPYSKALMFLWTILAFCGVLALMAVTSRITQDVPPVPFLWILPLAIYLLSYIVGFIEKQKGWQDGYICLLVLAFVMVGYLFRQGLEMEIRHQIGAYSFILLAICLFCHNALYRTKPDPGLLTGFYFCISLGGAMGGIFSVFAAPMLFKGYWEYQLVLLLAGVLAVVFVYKDSDPRRIFHPIRHALPVLLLGFALFLGWGIAKEINSAVYMERSFFGSVRVVLEYNKGIPIYSLLHGRINHGMQIHHPRFIHRATTYYSAKAGGGLAILNHPKRLSGQPMRVGLVGMGAGVLSVHGKSGDVFRFYEIDPAVIKLAQRKEWFSFLADSEAEIQIVPGDGRISLEAELPEHFDVLVLDAFSGDQVPVQTLTLEAFQLYLRHLEDDGVIAVHISNRNLDLLPVLVQVSNRLNLYAAYIKTPGDMKITANAEWVLLTRNAEFVHQPAIAQVDVLRSQSVRDIRPWTDDYSNLLSVMK